MREVQLGEYILSDFVQVYSIQFNVQKLPCHCWVISTQLQWLQGDVANIDSIYWKFRFLEGYSI